MSSTTHPDLRFVYPVEFVEARRKFIVIRECFATAFNPHLPKNYEVGDVALHTSFVWEYANQYCCLVNSQCMKKKKYEVLGFDSSFVMDFRTIDNVKVQPDQYLFDFLLCYEKGE